MTSSTHSNFTDVTSNNAQLHILHNYMQDTSTDCWSSSSVVTLLTDNADADFALPTFPRCKTLSNDPSKKSSKLLTPPVCSLNITYHTGKWKAKQTQHLCCIVTVPWLLLPRQINFIITANIVGASEVYNLWLISKSQMPNLKSSGLKSGILTVKSQSQISENSKYQNHKSWIPKSQVAVKFCIKYILILA